MERKYIIGIAAVVVLLLVSTATFYDLNGGSLDPTDREVRLIVTGSMDGEETDYEIPTIPVYSLVMFEHLSQEELGQVEIGDVLVFNLGDMQVFHRVIAIDSEGQTFTTKGDANKSSETVDFEDTLGVVVGVSPALGKIVHFVQENLLFILIGLVALMGIAWGIKDILKGKSKEEEE